jgi:LEA14-like dessication related protein
MQRAPLGIKPVWTALSRNITGLSNFLFSPSLYIMKRMMQPSKTSRRCTRRWLLIIAVILVICAVLIGVVGTRACKEWLASKAATADINIESISIKSISLTTVTVDVAFSVQNTNPISAVLHRLAYVIYFEQDGSWVQLGTADRNEDTTIKAHSYTSIDVTNEIGTLSAAGALYQAYKQGGAVNLKVVGSAWVGIGPITMEIPFQRIEKIGF